MRYVKASKPVSTNHPKLGDVKVEIEVPECESIDEFVTFAGGEKNALEYVNSAIATASKNGVRTGGRAAAEDITLEDLIAKLQANAKNYTPSVGRGQGTKAKAEKLDTIAEFVRNNETFTREQLLAMLEATR